MISLELVELLYIVLIIAVVLLTGYLIVTLTRLNAVLRDVQSISRVVAKVSEAVDGWGGKAAAGVMGMLHYFADKGENKKTK